MMNRLNNILIGILWLLAATLGTTFWFNTMFGFNILSAQHWQHLAYMQASGQSIKLSFFVSMVMAVVITTFVLYKLLQPRFRQIALPVVKKHSVNLVQPTLSVTETVKIKESIPDSSNEPQVKAQLETERPQFESRLDSGSTITRPPHLNIPKVTQIVKTPVVQQSTPIQPRINPETEYTDIRNAFESAGYLVKGAPKIKNVQTAIVAIGTNEVLWIGAVGVKNADMQRAVDTLSGIFSDTLDDIEIHINAFIIASPDTKTDTNILHFATVEDLRDYLSNQPNTPPDQEESESFDAYSGYIGTVIDYIGKI